MTFAVSRRGLMTGIAGAGAASLIPLRSAVRAQTAAPQRITYTRRVADIEVTTLLDGYFLLEQAWITALDPTLIVDGLTAAALDPTAALPLPITGYLIRHGGTVTLIDTGAGGALGPTAGNLVQTLAGLGVAPEAVSRIVISHLHPDHIGGMLTGDVPAFPNATVHLSETERAFWVDPASANRASDAMKSWFTLARQVIAAYADRVRTFTGDADLGGGVSSVSMPGHTPGHTGYCVSSAGQQALLWADSTALASLQFKHPDAGIVFDTDSVQAAQTRRRVLDMVIADKMLVSGTHMPFPGFGHVAKRDEAYAWVPEEWKLF